MIIVKLKGGLGNQLFQYAMGRSLALKKNTLMKIDNVSGFRNDPYGRVYSLGYFNIVENFASAEEVATYSKTNDRGYVYRILNKLKPYYRRSIVAESVANRIMNSFRPYYKCSVVEEQRQHQFNYDPNILLTNDDVYLEGYWQNEKYFITISNLIRQEFRLRFTSDWLNQSIAHQIINTNSVSVHLRRLHGVSADGRKKFIEEIKLHGACSIEYYQAAIHELTEAVGNPHFFIFSDDHDWAQEHLNLDYPITFVTHNDVDKCHEDLRLMSLCKHHIIANSSFSWWGAWLSDNPNKIVIASKKWLNTNKFRTEGLIPDSWHRI